MAPQKSVTHGRSAVQYIVSVMYHNLPTHISLTWRYTSARREQDRLILIAATTQQFSYRTYHTSEYMYSPSDVIFPPLATSIYPLSIPQFRELTRVKNEACLASSFGQEEFDSVQKTSKIGQLGASPRPCKQWDTESNGGFRPTFIDVFPRDPAVC